MQSKEWFDVVLMILSVRNTATIHVAVAAVENVLCPYYLPRAICKYNAQIVLGEKEGIVYWF